MNDFPILCFNVFLLDLEVEGRMRKTAKRQQMIDDLFPLPARSLEETRCGVGWLDVEVLFHYLRLIDLCIWKFTLEPTLGPGEGNGKLSVGSRFMLPDLRFAMAVNQA